MTQPVAVIGVPSSAGARQSGQEGGPAAIRAAGLLAALEETGVRVEDLGDSPAVTFRDDPSHPKSQNAELVALVARQTAGRVRGAIEGGLWPLVLGGDCTISLGALAGMIEAGLDPGVFYFDGDLDLNTPASSPSGVFDGMVVAHALGAGDPLVAGLGPRVPLLGAQDIVLFGFDTASGWVDAVELEEVERRELSAVPASDVRRAPGRVAADAVEALASRRSDILVHFDVDVTDTPVADVPHPGGLPGAAAFEALSAAVAHPACRGLVVTELNPARDSGGAGARHIVRGVVKALGAR